MSMKPTQEDELWDGWCPIRKGAMKIDAHNIPDLGPEVYAGWRSSTVGAITEALQSRLIMQMLGVPPAVFGAPD
jgi:hypothetical protein